MNKIPALLFAGAVILISSQTAFAQQELTQREWNIYYDYVEKSYGVSFNDKEARDQMAIKVVADHGISMEELSGIMEKAMAYGLTPEEEKIYQAYNDKLQPFMPYPNREQVENAGRQTAAKFGLTPARMDDIISRSVSSVFEGGQ